MFNIFFKKNYKNDVYKVEIINMKELEKIKESNISLEEKSDDKDISEKEKEYINKRIRKKIYERNEIWKKTLWSAILIIIGLLVVLLILQVLNLNSVEEGEKKNIFISMYDSYKDISLPFIIFYLTFWGNVFYHSINERRKIEDDIFALGLDLYKTNGLDKDIVSFFNNNIFKDYKESIRDRIKKHFTQ